MRTFLLLFLLFASLYSQAGGMADAIYEAHTMQPMDEFYRKLYASLEDSGFYVIFEANIGKNLARNADKWGEDYNRNRFDAVRSMVICSPYYANQVLNLDPKMMALCPITITVLHKQGESTVLFERLTPPATGSDAENILWEVENSIISAIENVL
ncbi:MAG TPA: DUF302 domain-containing protein [Gammaproteobacteria bacterium]|nr:DUF302 domain-containing protein [Gammaproteobacteria bacterium]